MRKNILLSSFLMAGLLAGAGSNAVHAQKKDEPAAQPQTCEEFLAKPISAEDLKKLSDENRKLYDAEVKRCKEGLASNEKAKNANAIVNRAIKEGNDAFNSKNYDVAVVKYDEGYNADTEYWGSAPVLLKNKAAALRARGIVKFNAAAASKDKAAREAGRAEAAKDFQDSAEALQKAADVYGKSTVPTDAAQAKNFNDGKFAVVTDRVESYRLLIKADASKAGDAVKAYEEYIAVEPDAKKKQQAQLTLAQAIFTSGDIEKAIPEYRKVLAVQADNPDALYELGSSLIAMGDQNDNKAMKSEGVAMMEKFVKAAPSGYDQAKLDDAKGQIEIANAKEPVKAATGGSKKKN